MVDTIIEYYTKVNELLTFKKLTGFLNISVLLL